MSKLSALLFACALMSPVPAFALSCGDTVTSDVQLTADLHCPTGTAALHVRTSGVTIDLNGHALSGDSSMLGISVYSASNVTIAGPGKIRGFSVGVYGERSHELKVFSVDFEDIGVGASISHAMKNTFAANTFNRIGSIALAFYDNSTIEPRRGLSYHNIVDNAFADVRGGVQLCGMETGGSVVANNSFARTEEFAIRLRDGSERNTLRANVIADNAANGIVVIASSMNKILDNLIDTGTVGVLVQAGLGSCNRPPGGFPHAYSNDIENNTIRAQIVGVQFGIGDSGSGRTVYKNFARDNRLHDNFVGIHFRIETVSNGGRPNDFSGTTVPVIDDSGYNHY